MHLIPHKVDAMRTAVVLLTVLAASATIGEAVAQEAAAKPGLHLLKGLIGKRADDPSVQSLLHSGRLSIYSKKQMTESLPHGKLRQRTATLYGGEGYLLVVDHDCVVEEATAKVLFSRPATVKSVQIICGDCEEAVRLGKWTGELPQDLQLPSDPSTLLSRHVEADYDREEIVNEGRSEISRRRRIYFGGPIPENVGCPYGFIFDNNKLSLVVLLPSRQSIVIPPTKPAVH